MFKAICFILFLVTEKAFFGALDLGNTQKVVLCFGSTFSPLVLQWSRTVKMSNNHRHRIEDQWLGEKFFEMAVKF